MTNKRTKLINRPKITKKYTLHFILISLFIILTLSMGAVSAADWTVGPDGSYNYNSIQDAINNESTLSGDTITVDPNGTDPYSENVVVNKNNLTIQANGAVIVSGSSNPSSPVVTINSGGSLAKIFGFNLTGATGSAGVLIDGANNVNLANLTISNCQVGVRTQSSNDIIVENGTMNQVTNGFLVDNAGYASSNNITLKNWVINSPTSYAIYIGQYSSLTRNLLIDQLTITNSGATAIQKHGEGALEHITIQNTQITNPQGNGISMGNHPYWHQLIDVTIDGLNIQNAIGDGIYINMGYQPDSYNITIQNTTINGSTGNGATINGRGTINITDNTNSFTNNTGWGLHLTGTGPTTTNFQNNNITNNGNGLYLNNIHNIQITNTLANNGNGIGIQLASCTNITIQDTIFTNTIKAYTNAILLSGTNENITLQNLTITNPTSYAIYLGGYGDYTKNILINNVNITNSGATAIQKGGEAALEHITIQNTQITNPQGNGIYLTNHPYWHQLQDVIINNVTITEAKNDGIYINMGYQPDSYNITIQNTTINGSTGNGATINGRGTINITDNTNSFTNNTGWGLHLTGTGPTTTNFQNNNITNNGNGLYLQGINGVTFQDNCLINNTGDDLYAAVDTNNVFTRLTIGLAHPTTVSFNYLNGIIVNGVENAPADPSGLVSIGKYVDIQGLGSTTVNLTVHYNATDVAGKNENGLRMFHYGNSWSELSQPNGVNTVDKYVYAYGINSFSAFAPLAEKFSTTLELPDVTGYRNEEKEISATLKDSNGNGVAFKEIKFFVDGTEVGLVNTNASGVASITYSLTESAGVYSLSASFAGDDDYKSSANNTATLTVNKRPTTLTVNNTSGVNGQEFVLAARLTTAGIAVYGATINFTIGSNSYTATTGTDGWATVTDRITQIPGDYNIGAEFTETGYFQGSAGTGTLTVYKNNTNIVVTDVTGINGQKIQLLATLTNQDGTPLNGKTVDFTINGMSVGSAVTEGDGKVTLTYTLLLTPGIWTINATFDGDDNYNTTNTTGTLTVYKNNTNIVVTDVAGVNGQNVNLQATLTNQNGTPLAVKTIQFTVNGTNVGSATTNTNGIATLNYPITKTPGIWTINATFTGDNNYNNTYNTGILTVYKNATNLAVSNVTGAKGQNVTLQVTLTNQNGTPLQGKPVHFTVNGTDAGSTTTNASGIGTLTYNITQSPGTYTIRAVFNEDDDYNGTIGIGTLNVDDKSTSLVVSNVQGKNGTVVDLNATLTDGDGNPLTSHTLFFRVDGNLVGSADTINGVASLPYTINLTGGTHTIQVDFQGNADYQASTGYGNLRVPQSSLYIKTTASKTNPTIGETITLTFKLGNNGPDTAENVVFTLVIPEGMEFINASTDQGTWTYNNNTRTITWNLGNVTVGDPNLWAIVRVLNNGNYVLMPFVSTATYDPNLNSNIQPLTISVQTAAQESKTVVNAATVGMQNTGLPIGLLVMGILMALGGILVPQRKK